MRVRGAFVFSENDRQVEQIALAARLTQGSQYDKNPTYARPLLLHPAAVLDS